MESIRSHSARKNRGANKQLTTSAIRSTQMHSESIGGYRDVTEALRLGKVKEILDSSEWTELVYAVRPDAWVRGVVLKKRSEMSLNMSLQDSHKFSYVHRERWSKIKRYLGKHPEIEEFPMVHRRRRRKSIPMQPLE
ncbi:hypothetical protein GGI19_000261 [Coemansia pectinata]|uniref:Uncharacterized protein n=1 Tax=Coemansia pectinata TaxID=1052879 RepID=A0A9W8H0K3_9FUNG|nr:hypothetical protein GGI19_000261 [Coemansia pectinata]